jgi:broad specificity phosphatase PhoE
MLVRQQRTAQIVEETMVAAGRAWPKIQASPELNEYDADGLLTRLAPALAQRNDYFRNLQADYEINRSSPDRNRYFQKMFEIVMGVWLRGELEIEGVESWAAFNARVRGALKRMMSAEGSGRRVAVFTSGGVIGLSVQAALGAPEKAALEINWRVRNCSLTEFVFSRDRLSLDSFNVIPHLISPELRTYR